MPQSERVESGRKKKETGSPLPIEVGSTQLSM
jgi:hypothetical protein